ncbi:unnamed protein product [Sphagnum tenellum]
MQEFEKGGFVCGLGDEAEKLGIVAPRTNQAASSAHGCSHRFEGCPSIIINALEDLGYAVVSSCSSPSSENKTTITWTMKKSSYNKSDELNEWNEQAGCDPPAQLSLTAYEDW